MALNLESVGKVWGPYEFNFNERDLIIYALGIGFTNRLLKNSGNLLSGPKRESAERRQNRRDSTPSQPATLVPQRASG